MVQFLPAAAVPSDTDGRPGHSHWEFTSIRCSFLGTHQHALLLLPSLWPAGKRVVDYLNSRRKAGKEWEYEVVWVGQDNHPRNNSWLPRTQLDGMGLAKMCNDLDARLAGLMKYRPLSTQAVMGHLADFGLAEDTAAHTAIRGLSGGQKVRGGGRAGGRSVGVRLQAYWHCPQSQP